MKKINLFIIFVLMSFLYPFEASAIPAFARKNDMPCSVCHTAWPMLNSTGRHYKENGYRFSKKNSPTVKISESLSWDESLPVSVLLSARPYDKKDSGERQLRALHEAELMVAGPMGKKMSGFFEIEAEDEDTNNRGLDVGIPAAALSYNNSDAFNLQFSYADLLWFDAYNTYSNSRRLTRGVQTVVGNTFGGADNEGSLNDARQNITLYGRPVEALFYGVSLSGSAKDAEGVDGQTMTLRLAYEMIPDIMFGVMQMNGSCTLKSGLDNCNIIDRDYSRSGIDMQATITGLVMSGAYLLAKDDNVDGTLESENHSYFFQATYINPVEGRSLWVPLVRLDVYEKNNAIEEITELTMNVTHYFTENVKGFVEYWDRVGEASTVDDSRLTLQLMAAF